MFITSCCWPNLSCRLTVNSVFVFAYLLSVRAIICCLVGLCEFCSVFQCECSLCYRLRFPAPLLFELLWLFAMTMLCQCNCSHDFHLVFVSHCCTSPDCSLISIVSLFVLMLYSLIAAKCVYSTISCGCLHGCACPQVTVSFASDWLVSLYFWLLVDLLYVPFIAIYFSASVLLKLPLPVYLQLCCFNASLGGIRLWCEVFVLTLFCWVPWFTVCVIVNLVERYLFSQFPVVIELYIVLVYSSLKVWLNNCTAYPVCPCLPCEWVFLPLVAL